MTQTILVLGAAGRLGRTVATAFLAAGWQVRGLVRPGGAGRLPAGVVAVAADATDEAAVVAAAMGTDVIFHGLNPAYTNWESVLPMGDIVVAAAKASGATILFPGNVYAFGAGMPARLTPETPEAPTTTKGHIRQSLEQRFRDASTTHRVQTIILRAGDFFGGDGPGTWFDLAIIKDLGKSLAKGDVGGVAWPTADLERIHAWAYLPDLAATFVALAEQRRALPAFRAFHFEGHNVTGAAFLAAIDAAVVARGHAPLRRSTIPWWSYRLVGPFLPIVKAILEMRFLWETPHALVDDGLAGIIGPVPHTPLAVAAAAVTDTLLGPVPVARRRAA